MSISQRHHSFLPHCQHYQSQLAPDQPNVSAHRWHSHAYMGGGLGSAIGSAGSHGLGFAASTQGPQPLLKVHTALCDGAVPISQAALCAEAF